MKIERLAYVSCDKTINATLSRVVHLEGVEVPEVPNLHAIQIRGEDIEVEWVDPETLMCLGNSKGISGLPSGFIDKLKSLAIEAEKTLEEDQESEEDTETEDTETEDTETEDTETED